jgi:hypothetical protein
MESKRCRDCGETKPLSEFYVNSCASDGRASYCRPCHTQRNVVNSERRREGRKKLRAATLESFIASGVQACRKCGIEKSFGDFYSSKDTITGVRTICKMCCNAIAHVNREPSKPKPTDLERLEKWVRKEPSGCWIWTRGEGMNFWLNGTTMNARRAVLVLSGTSVGPGFEVNAGCQNRLCVAPEHSRVSPLGDGLRHDRKRCSMCKIVKPLAEFSKSATGQKGRHGYCKKCKAEDVRRRARLDPKRTRRALAQYGMTQADFDRMYEAQGGGCAICGGPGGVRGLVVDHDHDSGAVRQLLCSSCNAGIAMLQHNEVVIGKALDYVSRWNAQLEAQPTQSSLVFE